MHAIEPEYRTYDQIKNSNFPLKHIILKDIEDENLAYEHWLNLKDGRPFSDHDWKWYTQAGVLGKEDRKDLPTDVNPHQPQKPGSEFGKSIVIELMNS